MKEYLIKLVGETLKVESCLSALYDSSRWMCTVHGGGIGKSSELRVGKNKPNQPHGIYLFRFSAKCVGFSAKFWSLNKQFINNLKDIILKSYKWCISWKHCVNSMKTSSITCKKEKTTIIWVKYMIHTSFPPFQYCHNLRILFAQSWWPDFHDIQNIAFSNSERAEQTQYLF